MRKAIFVILILFSIYIYHRYICKISYFIIHPIFYMIHRIFFTTQPIPLASESKGIVQKRLAYQALGRLFRGQSPYHTMILNQKFPSKSGPCAKNSQHPI